MKLMDRIRKKQIIPVLLLAMLCTGMAWADETTKPAYQIADNTFFDPTRKQEKKEAYVFRTEYRLEAGYVQHWQRTREITFPDM